MKQYKLKKLETKLYEYKCQNGLEVYLLPDKRFKSFFVSLNVKYGANNLKFKVNDKIISSHPGTAHFLEHKMFEEESKTTPFEFYAALGLDCNASTTTDKTDYVFSGVNHFLEGLDYVLKYVNSPYFTDENVEKEKGIIKQELLMYEDNPSEKLYVASLKNTYFKYPIKNAVGGKVKDIMKIKVADLKAVYEAFYRPDNMFLVISGSFDVNEALQVIESHHQEKQYNLVEPIFDFEPYKIKKSYVELKGNVVIPKFAINFKVKVKDLKIKIPDYLKYLDFYLESVLGLTSKLKATLTKEKLLNSSLYYDLVKAGDYVSIIIMGETEYYQEVIAKIKEALESYQFNQEDLEMNKKLLKSYYLYISDNIYSLNAFIAKEVLNKGKINENIYFDVDKMNEREYNLVVSHIDFTNCSVVVLKK